MADTTTRYRPRAYRRVCDTCGMLRNIDEMHFQDSLWTCTYDMGERVRTELDKGNARQRPFTIKPVPNPKPLDNYYPNLLETDDAAVFNFLARQVTAQCRYESVQSGQAAYVAGGQGLTGLSWAARYYYDLIQENDPSRRQLIAKAKELLNTIATFLQTRQRGLGFSGGARNSTAFYGGFLASGATSYLTADAATCGLALLYAYRILGTRAYLDGARAAANYLRNVQAIGSNATQFTSTNAAGTARFYTGAVCSEVSTVSGADPGQNFYSNHLFYPSGLLALELWNELKITDGDQSIGATAVVDGFDTIPAQLLSQSITDMRNCWTIGIQQTTGTVINGLSTTTPFEFFNAYPASKTGFTVIGTGLWEYVDGPQGTGTNITSQNFATALSALYNYEGATGQVTTLSDWLRSFTSNPSFETPANTSTPALYRSTTGTYDPTICLATLLTVVGSNTNGSSIYDWGSFGLMSRIWASRNKASFRTSRLYPLNTVQRFYDGNANDGLTSDHVILRGLSGLTMQTGFSTDLNGYAGATAYPAGTGAITSPSTEGNVLFLDGAKELTPVSGTFVSWKDQAGQHQDINVTTPGQEPTTGAATINGIPCVTFPTTDGTFYAGHSGNLKDRNGVAMSYTHALTIYALFRPKLGASSVVGGPVFSLGLSPNFEALFDVEAWFTHTDAMFVFDNLWKLSGFQILGPDTSKATWNSVPMVGVWRSSGYPNLQFAYNNSANLPLTTQAGVPTTSQGGGTGTPPVASFLLGNCWDASGSIQLHNFHGDVAIVMIYDYEVTGAADTQNRNYLAYRSGAFTGANIQMVNDAVRAAQFGRSFRESRA